MDFLHRENFIEMGPNIVFTNVSHIQNWIRWNTIAYAPLVPIDFTAFYKVMAVNKNTVESLRT